MRSLLVLSLFFLFAGITLAADQATLAPDANKQAIVTKMDAIVLPDVVLNNASLREALSTIRQQASAADLAEPDPKMRGVNIILKLDPTLSNGLTVTLNLKKPTLKEAVTAIAEQCNLEVKPEAYAIAFVPRS